MIINLGSNAQSDYKAALQKGSIMAGGGLGLRIGNLEVTETDEFGDVVKSKINLTTATANSELAYKKVLKSTNSKN